MDKFVQFLKAIGYLVIQMYHELLGAQLKHCRGATRNMSMNTTDDARTSSAEVSPESLEEQAFNYQLDILKVEIDVFQGTRRAASYGLIKVSECAG